MQELIAADYSFPLHLTAAHKRVRASQRWGAQGSGTLVVLGMRSLDSGGTLGGAEGKNTALCATAMLVDLGSGQGDAAAAAAAAATKIWLCWRGARLDEGSA